MQKSREQVAESWARVVAGEVVSGLWMYFEIRATGFAVSTEYEFGLFLLLGTSIIN